MQRVFRAAIGTHNIDNCSRVCHSPTSYALRKSLGRSGCSGSFDDIEHAEVLLIIGANPTAGHPVAGARMKQAALKGTKLVTADPRRIELADYGVLHCPVHPGTNAAFLNGLAHVVIRDGLVDEEFVAGRTDGFDAIADVAAAYTPEVDRGAHGRPRRRRRARRAPLRRGRDRLDRVGPRRHRAALRLRVRPADLQPRAPDRQDRPARLRADAAARPEQRPGLVRHGRAARHVHGVPLGRRRGGLAHVRGALGRDDEARARPEDARDVRRRDRRPHQGDVDHRLRHRPVRSRRRARDGGAREPRVPRRPGDLRERDLEVRARHPPGRVVPREDRARSRTPSAASSSCTRRSTRPARPRPTSRSAS